MADFPVDPAGRTTLGNIVNRLEAAPDERREVLDILLHSAKPYKEGPLRIPDATPEAFDDSEDIGFSKAWATLSNTLNSGDDSRLTQAMSRDLAGAADTFADAFFGPLGMTRAQRDAMLRRLKDIFNDPRSVLSSVGDRNAARTATEALLDAEVARAKVFAARTEYAVPTFALVSAVGRANNRIDALATVGLSALERRFLEFDRGLQNEMVQVRLQAARAIYGEIGEAFTTALMFTGQVVVPAYTRAQAIRPKEEDFAARYARIYQDAFNTKAGKSLAAQERVNAARQQDLAGWKAGHDLKNRAFADAVKAIGIAAAEISRQLSAALNAVSASGSIGSSGTLSERWKTINIDEFGNMS